jgi:hypothetical protein
MVEASKRYALALVKQLRIECDQMGLGNETDVALDLVEGAITHYLDGAHAGHNRPRRHAHP